MIFIYIIKIPFIYLFISDTILQIQSGKKLASLKEQLAAVTPLVDDLRSKKDERVKKFADIKSQIDKISLEISEYCHLNSGIVNSLDLNEEDLSLRRLTEYETHLRSLQKEKVNLHPSHSFVFVFGFDLYLNCCILVRECLSNLTST